MRRGTTSTISFELPFSGDNIKSLRLVISQNDQVVITKTHEDCTINENTISAFLSQTDTLALKGNQFAKVQIRALMNDGQASASNIYEMFIEDILEDGVIE